MHDFVFSNAAYLAAFLALNDRKSRSDVTVQPIDSTDTRELALHLNG